MLSARDIREFNGFLRNASDRQVQGIFEKEQEAGRDAYVELAREEAARRGIFLEEDTGRSHSTMLHFPRWRVDVTVGSDLVKTFYETATTKASAIGKAKHKMRGAVSNAGPFKFKAGREGGEPKRAHSTKKPPAQLDREIAEALHGASGGGSLYKELIAAGIQTDHHESDLYVLDTLTARDIMKRYGKKGSSFTSQVDGKRWIDVPFAYEPFWEKASRAATSSAARAKIVARAKRR